MQVRRLITVSGGFFMSQKVSESHTGQNQPKPSREERDAAFSSGAGRKAVEEEKKNTSPTPPIGTDLETKADEEMHKR